MTQLVAAQYNFLGNKFSVIATVSSAALVVLASNFCSVDELIESAPIEGAKKGKLPELANALKMYERKQFELISKFRSIQDGPDFSQRVWREISRIKPGHTSTYLEIATGAGSPKATRAAGSACGKNAVPIFVPCHRVVPSAGGVGNYAGGVELKEQLLQHESGMRQVRKLTSRR